MVYIREIEEEDIETLYIKLNSEYINKYFLDRELEFKRLYFEYYRALLTSDRNLVYILEDKKRNFLGIVRFDLDISTKIGDVAVYFDTLIRDKGYFSSIMDRSIAKLKNKNLNIEVLRAYILEENIVSIRCFKKIGFKFKEKVYYRGLKHSLYIRVLDCNDK